jgi:hypothetical protein
MTDTTVEGLVLCCGSTKNVSGFKWDEDNGVDVNEDTLSVQNAYVEVSITFFLLISINPIDTEVSRFENKGVTH